MCNSTNLPEVEIISLLEEQLPHYKLRADTIYGYDHDDWLHTPLISPDANIDLTTEQIEETLKYFRKSKIQKLYSRTNKIVLVLLPPLKYLCNSVTTVESKKTFIALVFKFVVDRKQMKHLIRNTSCICNLCMLFSMLSNTGETEILVFTCDLSGKRLRFLYIYNIEGLDLFHYLLFFERVL